MKINLPIKLKGFTLVELLVVITILAILGMIALSVFSNAQKQARDAKRKSDIDAIAKSLEASRDFTTASGKYLNKFTEDFPPGVPTTPNTVPYCASTNASSFSDITNPGAWTGTSCPSGWSIISSSYPSTSVSFASWKVCASLETKSEVYCKGSMAR